MNDKLINKDVTKKILSIMLALLLWVYVITEQNPDVIKDITVPVRLINTVFLEENNMVLVNNTDNYRLTLKIKGKNKVLDKLNERTVEAVADMEGHNLKGDNFLKININGIPEDVNILQKSSESLKVVLEPKINVQKSVQVNLMGNPTLGLAAMTAVTVPNDVLILGAESQLHKINIVRVDVDIAGAQGDIKRVLPVRVLDEKGKDITGITVIPENVEVNIPIGNTKIVSLEMNLSGQPAEGYRINGFSMNPQELLITGKQNILDGIKSLKTEKIDINNGTADISKEVKLVIPEGIEIAGNTQNVNILVDIEKVITSEITVGSFEYINLPEDLTLEGIQGEVAVTIKGAESIINSSANSMIFYVDLKNAVEGSNAIDVLWNAPEGIEIQSVLPHQVSVVLKKKVE